MCRDPKKTGTWPALAFTSFTPAFARWSGVCASRFLPTANSAFEMLAKLGYRPLVPITAEQFADSELRQQWIRDKGMQVLNFFSDQHRETSVDVFVTEPFDFERESMEALQGELAPGAIVRFVSLPTLIAMKVVANRPRDIDDVQHLRWVQEENKPDE